MSMLAEHDILINSQTNNWRFKIQSKKLKISKSENFANVLKSKHQIFAFICASVVSTNEKINHELCVSKQIKNYKKLFDNEKIEMLFKQHDENHVIDLIKSKKLSFMLLYNLSQNELTKFRCYFKTTISVTSFYFAVTLFLNSKRNFSILRSTSSAIFSQIIEFNIRSHQNINFLIYIIIAIASVCLRNWLICWRVLWAVKRRTRS